MAQTSPHAGLNDHICTPRIFSSFRDEVHNEQHCSTMAQPTNDKTTPKNSYFKTDCRHFFTFFIAMLPNMEEIKLT
jgi:hypothetical protein